VREVFNRCVSCTVGYFVSAACMFAFWGLSIDLAAVEFVALRKVRKGGRRQL
jgi:hypothetical protein